MKKLLLLVFGLSLFMVGCADDSGSGAGTGGGTGGGTQISVKDFDIKINDQADPNGATVTGFSPNTTMSLKGGVFTINTTDTDILTKDITPSNMAAELVQILVSHFVGIGNAGRSSDRASRNIYYELRKQNISTFNAKIEVSDDEKSVTVDLVLLPVRGYAEKVFTVTLTSSAHKFAKPTFVKASDINYTFTQENNYGIEFTGGSDGEGSTVITKGQLVASSTPVTTTIPKALPITYDQFWQSAIAVANYGGKKQVVSVMHSLDGITKADDAKLVAGEHDMYGVMIFTNIIDENNNILFDNGYIFHILDLKTKLVKSTAGVTPPTEPVVINDIDLDISADAISAAESTDVIVITATPNIIVNGELSNSAQAIAFTKGTNVAVPFTKKVLAGGIMASFLKYIMQNPTLADAVNINLDDIENSNGLVVEVTSTQLIDPTVSLTINLKTGYEFEDGTATKTITGIKTSGTIVQ